ncbi:MAG TPA: hypothetical protein VFD09_10975 [Thiopseudomonas sp.]|nr:hypothetical protein [Thiopseudomonas sp.]
MKNRARSECVAKLQSLADAIENKDTLAIQIAHERIDVPLHAEFNIEHGCVVEGEDIEYAAHTGVEYLATFMEGDLMEADFSDATVVTLYGYECVTLAKVFNTHKATPLANRALQTISPPES